jgi:hypothetical protein
VGLIEKIEATQFLGQEFATWLCWHSETGSGKFKLAGLEEFDLFCEAPVQLVCDYGEATSITLKGGTPMQSPEARLALREGKKVDRMRVRVNYRNMTHTFGFNASSFALSGLKIPVPQNVSNADYIFVRLEMFEEFERFFQSVFERFLKLRLDEKAWSAEQAKIAEWVKSVESE